MPPRSFLKGVIVWARALQGDRRSGPKAEIMSSASFHQARVDSFSCGGDKGFVEKDFCEETSRLLGPPEC